MGIHGGHCSIISWHCRWTAITAESHGDAAEGSQNEKSASHAKGQAVAVGVVIGIAILLIVLLKLI